MLLHVVIFLGAIRLALIVWPLSGTTFHVQALVKLTSPKDYGTVTVAQKPS